MPPRGPSDRRPAALAPPRTSAFDDQRRLLLELLVDPPPDGDAIADLAAALDRPAGSIAAAAAALAGAGLADCERDRVRATPAALAFEALWPVRL
jgi:hypothetical protein